MSTKFIPLNRRPQVGDRIKAVGWSKPEIVTAVGDKMFLSVTVDERYEYTRSIDRKWEIEVEDEPARYAPQVGDRVHLPYWGELDPDWVDVLCVGNNRLFVRRPDGSETSFPLSNAWVKVVTPIKGVVQAAFGGTFIVVVDRETDTYPANNTKVTITVDE